MSGTTPTMTHERRHEVTNIMASAMTMLRHCLMNTDTEDVAASCSLDVSEERRDRSSPVLFLSKKAISCCRMALNSWMRSRDTTRSPAPLKMKPRKKSMTEVNPRMAHSW